MVDCSEFPNGFYGYPLTEIDLRHKLYEISARPLAIRSSLSIFGLRYVVYYGNIESYHQWPEKAGSAYAFSGTGPQITIFPG